MPQNFVKERLHARHLRQDRISRNAVQSSPGPTCLMLAEVDTLPQPSTSILFHLQQQSGLIENRVPLTLFVGLSCQAP